MFVLKVNVPNPVVPLPQHQHLVWSLDEIERLKEQILSGNAAGPATRLSDEVEFSFAGEQFLIAFLHLLCRPGLQNRIASVRNRNGEFAAAKQAAILDLAVIGISRVGLDRAVS